MSCVGCSCDAGLSNTGTGCTPIMQVARKVILVPVYDVLGNKNRVLYDATLNQAYFDTRLDNDTADGDKWTPLPDMKNVEDVRGDNIMETFDDQSTVFIQEASRKFTGIIVGASGSGSASPQLKGYIEQARCVNVGVYFVDKNGNLIGKNSSDGLALEPIVIDEQSLSVMLVKTTDIKIQKLQVSFNFDINEKDEDLRMIVCDELGGADLLEIQGELEVNWVFSAITSTTITVRLYTNYGTPINPLVVTGMAVDNFYSWQTSTTARIRNTTDSADVTITGLTESPNGTYALTYASQTVGDVLQFAMSASGFDFNGMEDDLVTIPIS